MEQNLPPYGEDDVLRGLLTGPLGRELVAHEGSLQSLALWTRSDFVRDRHCHSHPLGFSVLVLLPRSHGEQPVRWEGAGRPIRAAILPGFRLFLPSAEIQFHDAAIFIPAIFGVPGSHYRSLGTNRGEAAGGRSPSPNRRQIPAGFGRRSCRNPEIGSSPAPHYRFDSRAGVVQPAALPASIERASWIQRRSVHFYLAPRKRRLHSSAST